MINTEDNEKRNNTVMNQDNHSVEFDKLRSADNIQLGVWTLPTSGGEIDRYISGTIEDVNHNSELPENGGQSGRITLSANGEIMTLSYNPFDARIAYGETEEVHEEAFAVVVSAKIIDNKESH